MAPALYPRPYGSGPLVQNDGTKIGWMDRRTDRWMAEQMDVGMYGWRDKISPAFYGTSSLWGRCPTQSKKTIRVVRLGYR